MIASFCLDNGFLAKNIVLKESIASSKVFEIGLEVAGSSLASHLVIDPDGSVLPNHFVMTSVWESVPSFKVPEPIVGEFKETGELNVGIDIILATQDASDRSRLLKVVSE